MKKLFSVLSIMLLGLMLCGTPSMACDGPDCHASGNFNIDVIVVGGGVDVDGKLIPGGTAGGIGVAGGVAGGEAAGEFTSLKIGRETIAFGSSEANIGVTAGGATNTEAYSYNPNGFDLGIGVGSRTDSFGVVDGHLDGRATGLAYSVGGIAGIAGEGSLDGSIVFGSPLSVWDSKGVSYGLAGQGAYGGFVGDGGALAAGSYEVEAGIEMSGTTYSESHRGIIFNQGNKTEVMGSNVGSFTQVTSYSFTDRSCIGTASVAGGFEAAGFAKSGTVQTVPGGFATANAVGSYSGSGELGCNFNGSAVGYTQTSATTFNGMNGSIMSSSAGMKVTDSNPK